MIWFALLTILQVIGGEAKIRVHICTDFLSLYILSHACIHVLSLTQQWSFFSHVGTCTYSLIIHSCMHTCKLHVLTYTHNTHSVHSCAQVLPYCWGVHPTDLLSNHKDSPQPYNILYRHILVHDNRLTPFWPLECIFICTSTRRNWREDCLSQLYCMQIL